MTDRERSQDAIEEEEAGGSEFGALNQDPEGGGDNDPTSENDPPIISSGG
jgi:hypothetical protein